MKSRDIIIKDEILSLKTLSTKSTVKKRKELHARIAIFQTCTMHYRSDRTEAFYAKAVIKTL